MLLPLVLLLSSIPVNSTRFAGLQKKKEVKKDSAQIKRLLRAGKVDSIMLALKRTDQLMKDIIKKDSIK